MAPGFRISGSSSCHQLLWVIYPASVSFRLVALWGTAWSAIANGTIPYALSLVPPARAGLGIGLFFGGSALAATCLGIWVRQVGVISPATSAFGTAIAFIIAYLCISIHPTLEVRTPDQSL